MGISDADAALDERFHDERFHDDWFYDHGDQVLAYLLHRTDEASAEELLQDVFVLASRDYPASAHAPVGSLFASARTLLARRGVRRGSMLIERMAEDAAETHHLGEAEWKFRFADALSKLGRADREVLTVSSWYGLSPGEAAEALGFCMRAYRVRLRRAQARLATALSASEITGQSPAQPRRQLQ